MTSTRSALTISEDAKRDEAINSSVVPAKRKGGIMKNSRAYMMALIGFMGIFLFVSLAATTISC